MLGFFIIISFFIHALSLAAIYLMYQQLQHSKQQQIKEMDQLMHSYIQQIQQENHELQEVLQKTSNLEQSGQTNQQYVSVAQDDNVTKETNQEQPEEWDTESVMQTSEGDRVETSLESRVLQLHQAGVPINEIAKQLGCGKTEASLIIQFQQEK